MDMKEFFGQVYDVLVENCQASKDSFDRLNFVEAMTRDNPTREYRFMGGLGFGGKFRYPGFTVDCYPEDCTPARQEIIDNANAVLVTMRTKYAQKVRD